MALLMGGWLLGCTSEASTPEDRPVLSPALRRELAADESDARQERIPLRRRCTPPPVRRPVPLPTDLPNVRERLPSWTVTLKATRRLVVREEPDAASDMVGEIKRYSRLPPAPGRPGGRSCRTYWMRVWPRGWVCGDFLKPDRRGELLRRQPLLAAGQMLPGRYAWVRRGGAKFYPNREAAVQDKPSGEIEAGFIIRWKKTLSLGGQAWWQNSKHYLVRASRLLRHHPSEFRGVDLRRQGLRLPVAIVRAKTRGSAVLDRPEGRELFRVSHHSAHEIRETRRVEGTKYYRIGLGRWLRARRVISAWPAPSPPPGLAPCERWIEVIIEHQSLVAYEGTEPVYATMISSGDKRHPTKYGIFRVWWKKAQGDMSSSMAGDERYRVDDVPWIQYFHLGQALHGAYWHSDWGNRRSHGCINLAPKDARWLYEWTRPHVPDGWISRRADADEPGTLLRVKHKRDHQVPFYRYARKLAPKPAVRRLDRARKERMRQKTLRLLRQKSASTQEKQTD